MAEDQATTAPVEAQPVGDDTACPTTILSLTHLQTTAPEASTETKSEAPAAPTEAAEGKTRLIKHFLRVSTNRIAIASATTNEKDAEKAETDPATAGAQATTEATAPDGTNAEAETVPSDGAAADGTAATPASAKGKRKSTGGVPEHKNKKANKRKSMVNLVPDAQPGDYFFAKFKGFPPWPSIICDESMLPETLLASRPVSALNSQGDLREDFQPGGKNAKDRTYPIMFLETNEL